MQLNRIQLVGNITNVATTKPVGDTSVTETTLASSRKLKNGKEEKLFILLRIWGARGEAFAAHISKSDPVFVEGTLNLDQWKDKESGDPRSRYFINVSDWQFAAPKVHSSSASDQEEE